MFFRSMFLVNRITLGFLVFVFLCYSNSSAQVDLGFMGLLGNPPNDRVNSILPQRDGRILIGGAFTMSSGLGVGRLIRYTPEGLVDTSFQTRIGFGANNWVNAMVELPDGRLLLGGQFAAFNGANVHGVIRLQANGDIDTTFSTPEGTEFMQRSVEAIAVQSNGGIIIGGLLRNYNGVTVPNFARLRTDGTLDSAFNVALGQGFNGVVRSIAILPDGKMLVAGGFTGFNGENVGCIVRLNANGTLDNSFRRNVSGFASAMTVQRNGSILVGGFLSGMASGTNIGNIVRVLPEGDIDTAFARAIGTGASSAVRAIIVLNDDKILLAGNFSRFNGQETGRLMRLNPDGTVDTRFQDAVGQGADDDVSTLAVQTNGLLLLGGLFSNFNNQNFPNFLRLSTRTSVSTRLVEVYKTSLCPNPVQNVTVFQYDIPTPTAINLVLHDVLGRTMKSFIQNEIQFGAQSFSLDLSDVPTGAYSLVMTSSLGMTVQRIVVAR
ncbi:MAG: T9SS type A sorting domain-containing protein [Candidatus Kapabacteria bacterium]|nr:T9SS type A sorting domain-containing protein [Candidatus Kapabacteria bacterium]